MSKSMGGVPPSIPTVRPLVIRPGRPSLRTTFQLAAKINIVDSVDQTFERSVRVCLDWIRGKFPQNLPAEASDCRSFEVDVPGQKIACICISELGLWSLRLEQPDAPYTGRAAVPGRTWTTDISLARDDQDLAFGVRVVCASLPYAAEEIALTRPRLVVDLAQKVNLNDVRPLRGQPWLVATEDDLLNLHELLTNEKRTLPVVLLTQPDRSRINMPVAEYILDAAQLARRTQGLAHVVQMPWNIGFKWTDMVGKPWSAYLGAVRTYMPGLNFDTDSPTQHPRTMGEDILFWRYNAQEGEQAFTNFLSDKLSLYAASKRVVWGACLFPVDARTKQAEMARIAAHDSEDWRKAYEDEIASLRAKIAEVEKEAEEFNDDAIAAGQEREFYKDENARLRGQVQSLLARLAEKSGETPDSAIEVPTAYEDIAEWVAKNLVGRLVLHSRALRGLKGARYENVGLVCSALLLLANEYRNMRIGMEGAKKAFDDGLARLGLRTGSAISKERAGEEADTYFIRYPTGSSPRCFLDMHLRKGTGRDERLCLAVYFLWDDDTQQVVVGWLPSHLDTRIT